MPVSISINISENSYSTTNNTSNVTVQVTASYTGGSYNQTSPGPELTVTVDGNSSTSHVGFNAGKNTSGTDVIYTGTYTIAHDSDGTKTLYCSASYDTGVSSGTVTASKSLVLTPTGGGSSGGDSSGGDEGDTKTYSVIVSPGEHTTIVLASSDGSLLDSNNLRVSAGYPLTISFSADEGYKLTSCTVNYEEVVSGEVYYVNSNVIIESSAVSIDGTACTITELHYTYDSFYPDWYNVTYGKVMKADVYSDGDYITAYITFTTPNFIGTSKYIKFSLPTNIKMYVSSCNIRYALCVSDTNRDLYCTTANSVDDIYCIESGTVTIIAPSDSVVTSMEFTVPTTGLNSNTAYYLFLWTGCRTDDPNDIIITLEPEVGYRNFTFALSYNAGIVYIDNGTSFESYQCYIDNGTSWDQYIPYIDNGTSWDICN